MQTTDKQEPLVIDCRWLRQGRASFLPLAQAPRQILLEISDHPGFTDVRCKPGQTGNLPITIDFEIIKVELRDSTIFAYVIDDPRSGIEF